MYSFWRYLMEKVTIKVNGMSCKHCENAVAGAVSELPGTRNVKVDLKAGTVSLEYDSGTIGTKEIGAAIEEAGFSCER
jgi:copper chaperone